MKPLLPDVHLTGCLTEIKPWQVSLFVQFMDLNIDAPIFGVILICYHIQK